MMMRVAWVVGLVAGAACGDDGEASDVAADGEVSEVGEVVDPDRQDPTCKGPELEVPTRCDEAVVAELPNRGQDHVREGVPITYEDVPPSSGDHRPSWGKWGEYTYLPPQRWLHNLEHGGIAFLYDPCVPEATKEALRAVAKALPADESGPFRWVMTPYPGLPTAVAVVAWQWTWQADCTGAVNEASLSTFITEHYRKGPEDVAGDGSYATDWIGR